MNKVLEYIIRAFDKTKDGTDSASKGSDSLAKRIGSNLMNIKAGWDMLAGGVRAAGGLIAGAARKVWEAVSEAFKFETLTVQFSVLMGSMAKAKARMKELADFAAATPFQLDEVVRASRQLHVFSGGAMGAKDSLRLIGDAAAAVGQNIEELSFWVGRAYSMIKGGQPFGEAAMRLQEMGVITPEVRSKMEELQKAGKDNAEVWAVLEKRLATFQGGMETLSKTGDGLVSTLKDNWTAAVRKFGESFMTLAKDEIGFLIARLQKLVDDGTVEKWANKALAAIKPLVEIMGNLFDDETRGKSMSASWDYLKSVFQFGFDMLKAGADYLFAKMQAAILQSLPKILGGNETAAKAYNEIADARLSSGTRAAQTSFNRSREDAAARVAELAQLRRVRELERAQNAPDPDGAAPAAQAPASPAGTAAARSVLPAVAADLAKAQREMSVSREAGDRLTRARSAAQQAWSWYQDPELLRTIKREEQKKAAEENQYQSELTRLQKWNTNWRTDTRLDERQDAVRRVALAREEESAAEESLKAIEVNTRDLATKMDEIIKMKE